MGRKLTEEGPLTVRGICIHPTRAFHETCCFPQLCSFQLIVLETLLNENAFSGLDFDAIDAKITQRRQMGLVTTLGAVVLPNHSPISNVEFVLSEQSVRMEQAVENEFVGDILWIIVCKQDLLRVFAAVDANDHLVARS